MFYHRVVHKVDESKAYTHKDSIACWCKPYIVSDPEYVKQEIIKEEISRQDLIDLYSLNHYPN